MTSNLNALDPLNATVRERLDQALRDCLPRPEDSDAPRLAEAMRYAALAGGKRIRPMLVYAAFRLAGGSLEQADVPAAYGEGLCWRSQAVSFS